MEEKKVIDALLKLGRTERQARKLIRNERKNRKKEQKERDALRVQKLIGDLLRDLY